MVLKLIESGGFLGRTRSAELDIQTLPNEEQKVIRDFLTKQAVTTSPSDPKSRDNFQYAIEFEGKINSLQKVPTENTVLTKVFERLVDQLSY